MPKRRETKKVEVKELEEGKGTWKKRRTMDITEKGKVIMGGNWCSCDRKM